MIIPKYEMRMETERHDASHHSNCMQCIASPQKPVMEAPDRAATSQIRPRVCQIMRDKLIGRFPLFEPHLTDDSGSQLSVDGY
jgi:hypothetical protein